MPSSQSKQSTPKPTESETKILSVIWEQGSATVREVFEILSKKEDIGHTTVLKLMQIMTEKGILDRDISVRPQVFRPSRSRSQTQRTLLQNLLNSAFSGSPSSLVLQALSMQKTTPEELREIRELLDQLEKNEK